MSEFDTALGDKVEALWSDVSMTAKSVIATSKGTGVFRTALLLDYAMGKVVSQGNRMLDLENQAYGRMLQLTDGMWGETIMVEGDVHSRISAGIDFIRTQQPDKLVLVLPINHPSKLYRLRGSARAGSGWRPAICAHYDDNVILKSKVLDQGALYALREAVSPGITETCEVLDAWKDKFSSVMDKEVKELLVISKSSLMALRNCDNLSGKLRAEWTHARKVLLEIAAFMVVENTGKDTGFFKLTDRLSMYMGPSPLLYLNRERLLGIHNKNAQTLEELTRYITTPRMIFKVGIHPSPKGASRKARAQLKTNA